MTNATIAERIELPGGFHLACKGDGTYALFGAGSDWQIGCIGIEAVKAFASAMQPQAQTSKSAVEVAGMSLLQARLLIQGSMQVWAGKELPPERLADIEECLEAYAQQAKAAAVEEILALIHKRRTKHDTKQNILIVGPSGGKTAAMAQTMAETLMEELERDIAAIAAPTEQEAGHE